MSDENDENKFLTGLPLIHPHSRSRSRKRRTSDAELHSGA